MSRLHDALKKAEQERVPIDALGISDVPLEPRAPGGSSSTQTEAPDPSRLLGEAPEPDPKGAGFAGPLKAFAEQCPQTEWAPDPGTVLFYGDGFRTPGSEEFRTLRSRLDLIRDRQPLQTLLITSAMPGEGKTFVAANLAQVIVWQRERHVLLIDGDLRSSKLHQALGVSSVPGLSDYLSGKVNEFAIVRRGPLENFFFIPSGTPAPNATELLGNGRLRNLLKRLSVAFDWILIDSPPVIPVADARLIAESSDGVLLVVRSGGTPSDLAQLAYREFRGKPFVGVVLNKAQRHSRYGYDYQRGAPSPSHENEPATDVDQHLRL
jgi:protein-tyrosine kinase